MVTVFRALILLLFCPLMANAVESRIYAQLVTAAGVKSGSPVEIYSGAAGPQSRARVSFYNDRFLVVWNEWNGSHIDIKGARIAMDGTVLDTTPLSISTSSRTQAMPDVAADNTGWMVVYHRFPAGAQFASLYAKRVDYDGTVNAESDAFGNSSDIGSGPKISWNDTAGNFLVVFNTMRNDYQIASRPNWGTLSSAGVYTSSGQYYKALKSCPEEFEIAPIPGTSGWTWVIHGSPYSFYSSVATINMAGAVNVDSSGQLNPNGYMTNAKNPMYLGSDSSELLSYQPDSNLGWIMGGTAAVADSSYVIGVWEQHHRVSSVDFHKPKIDLYAGRIDDYLPVDPVGGVAVAATTDVFEINPALAGDGAGNVLLAYEKITDGSSEIIGKILTISGGISPGSEIEIRTDATNGSRRTNPHVAYGDDGVEEKFLVVWTEGWWGI